MDLGLIEVEAHSLWFLSLASLAEWQRWGMSLSYLAIHQPVIFWLLPDEQITQMSKGNFGHANDDQAFYQWLWFSMNCMGFSAVLRIIASLIKCIASVFKLNCRPMGFSDCKGPIDTSFDPELLWVKGGLEDFLRKRTKCPTFPEYKRFLALFGHFYSSLFFLARNQWIYSFVSLLRSKF